MENVAGRIRENIKKVIIGKDEVIDLLLTALVTGGHVLLEDVPGTGKTVLAKSLAKSISGTFSRIQFTPDLLPSDVTGLTYYNQKQGEFIFKEGPVFCNILLGDEINRATPRTQSSLLECMEEKQVTIDGITYVLSEPFFVIATQNPIETIGTFPLPEAQMDRFLMQLAMGFPSQSEELEILNRFILDTPLDTLKPVCETTDLITMKQESKKVFVHKELMSYIVAIVTATRENNSLISGISPRGTLALLKASQSYAYIKGRNYVVPEDIKNLCIPVLAHRLVLSRGVGHVATTHKIIEEIVKTIPTPTENWSI